MINIDINGEQIVQIVMLIGFFAFLIVAVVNN